MSVTVTIHNGEMGQIKHFIDEKKRKGQLYGLWTHSNQPVIQYVTGAVKEHEKEKIGSYLLNNHGLKHVGNWSTSKFDDVQDDPHCLSFVSMTVNSSPSNKKAINVEQMLVLQNDQELNGEIEILAGDSAFRLLRNGPFQGDSLLTDFHHGKVDPIDVESLSRSTTTATEVTVRGEQWYSTDEGMKLFGKIFGALKQEFAISGTSRSTDTHDISISIKILSQDFSVDFQSDFPEGKAFLKNLRSGKSCQIEMYKDSRDETKTKATKRQKQDKASLHGESKRKQKGSKKQSGKVAPVEDEKGEAESGVKQERKKEGGDGDEDEEEEKNEEQDREEDEENSPPSGYEVDQKSLDDDTIVQLLVQGILRLTLPSSIPGGTGGSCSRKKGGSNSGGRGGSHPGGTGGAHDQYETSL